MGSVISNFGFLHLLFTDTLDCPVGLTDNSLPHRATKIQIRSCCYYGIYSSSKPRFKNATSGCRAPKITVTRCVKSGCIRTSSGR